MCDFLLLSTEIFNDTKIRNVVLFLKHINVHSQGKKGFILNMTIAQIRLRIDLHQTNKYSTSWLHLIIIKTFAVS